MARKKISRRQFMETSVVGTATAASLRGLDPSMQAGSQDARGRGSGPELRSELPLNDGWSFKRQASPGSGTEPEFVGAAQIDAISGIAAINVQSTGQAGEIIIEAESPGLGSGSARLVAVQRQLRGKAREDYDPRPVHPQGEE